MRRRFDTCVTALSLTLVALGTLSSSLAAPSGASLPGSARDSTFRRGPGSPEVGALLLEGKFSQAERKVRALLGRVDQDHGTESLEAAELLDQLVVALRSLGKAGEPEAIAACRRALGIKERIVGVGDPRYAASLFQLGYLHYVNTNLDEARRTFERVLDIQQSTLGGDHLDVASTLVLLAASMSDAGESSAAEPLVERSLAIRIASLGSGHLLVGESLNALASIKLRLGDFSGALGLYEQALNVWGKSGRQDRIATAHNNLGAVLYLMGDYERALSHNQRALDLRVRAFGRNHELVATAESNVGIALAALGRVREARPHLQRALRIQEKRFGANSAEVGWTLGRTGMLSLQARDYRAARPTLARATELLRKGSGEHHQDFAEALAALATATAALGDADSALAMYERALHVMEESLGPVHPDVGLMLTQYARLLAATGEDSLALAVALRGEEISREHLRLTARSLPERQALAYAAARPAGGRVALSIMAEQPDAPAGIVTFVWDALVRARTLVLDEMASRNRAASRSGDPEARRLAEDLAVARRRLANLLVAGPQGDPPDRYRASVERSRAAAERAERNLAETSTAFRLDLARDRLGLEDVVSSLPRDAALVAYATAGDSADLSFVAFVFSCDDSVPDYVRLGPVSTIEERVSRWLSDVSHGREATAAGEAAAESRSRASGLALRQLIWDPVASRLHTATRVFVVPEGAMNLVNFAALPADGGRYLVEEGFVFHYLSSERDLVPRERPVAHGSGLLALGEPSFDLPGQGAARRSPPPSEGDVDANCDPFRSLRFRSLPETGEEVREVATIWGAKSPSKLLLGADATEAAFKAASPGRDVIHLATHGFFLDGSKTAGTPGSVRGIGAITTAKPAPCRGNPLRLSGLAFAGANERTSATAAEEDGILIAEEVSALDLDGVKWVVLSACDTGKGRIQSGEGVLGLRRAFQIAGAHAVIMSLWAVEDEAARRWMSALYRARIVEGMDAPDAAAEANRSVLRWRRAQARSGDPFYWAAFVATGDWK